ncbi:hypothetical protein GF327_03975 [Candidatus Woesearchaeota archaeon]|nr:hypothetical protein [Candidatus Woesearchaeota archaeon]
MKKYYKFVILFLIIFNLTCVYADSFKADFTAVKNSIYLDENALFNIKITNTGDIVERIQIYTPDLAWSVDVEPAVIKLHPKESKNITLEILPSAWATTGPQVANIVIESLTTREDTQEQVSIYVKDWSIKHRQYAPSVELRVRTDESIDPRENIPVEIYLRNRNRLNIEDMEVLVESQLFYKKMQVSLSGLEERTEGIVFSVDHLTPPQDTTVDISIVYQNETINEVSKDISVIAYSDFIEQEDEKKSFFKSVKDITLENKGNYEKSGVKKIQAGLFESLFLKTTPEAEKKYEDGNVYYTWVLSLEPEQEFKITLVTNYRLVIYLLIIVILLFIFYYISRSPVISKKEILVIGSTSAGISEMKILIYIKNRTSDIVNNVTVSDKLPSIADLVKESYLGTLEPSKILRHDKRGTIVKWEMNSLEPFEERVIAYRIKSKLNIVGGISLPPVKIKFDTSKGRERIVFSNKCELRIKK